MFNGFVTLGNTLTGGVLCRNSSGTPTAPDAAPTVKIYGPSGTTLALMTNGSTTGTSVSGVTGLYSYQFTLSGANGFAAGTTYFLTATFAISGTTRGETQSVTVV